jgi:hypothetical protein
MYNMYVFTKTMPKYLCIYSLSKLHNKSLINAYFGLDSRECKCLEYIPIHTYLILTLYPRKGNRDITDIERPTFYQNDLAMRYTADVTGGKPIAAYVQSSPGACAVNPLVVFYDIHGRK